jgi:predicted metal-binding protein
MNAEVVIRSVECLNGCHHPAMAALSTPGKPRIRLSDLTEDDAPKLIEAALAHGESQLGTPEEDILPAALMKKLAGPATPAVTAAI